MKNVNSWNLLSRGLDLIAYISLDDVHWMVLLKLIFVTFISYLQYNFGQIFLWMIITLPTRQNYVTAWSFAWPIFFETPSKNGGRVLTKSGLAIYAPFGLIKLCRICQSGRFDWRRFSPGGAQIGHWGRFDNSVSGFLRDPARADSAPLACPSGIASGLARSQNRP